MRIITSLMTMLFILITWVIWTSPPVLRWDVPMACICTAFLLWNQWVYVRRMDRADASFYDKYPEERRWYTGL